MKIILSFLIVLTVIANKYTYISIGKTFVCVSKYGLSANKTTLL